LRFITLQQANTEIEQSRKELQLFEPQSRRKNLYRSRRRITVSKLIVFR
jgi:hypothetical protein